METAAVLLLLAMLAAVFLGVIFRLAGEPLAWSDELAQYLLVWTSFTGWIIASRRRSHIRIGLIVDRLKGPLRRIAEIVSQFDGIAALVAVAEQERVLSALHEVVAREYAELVPKPYRAMLATRYEANRRRIAEIVIQLLVLLLGAILLFKSFGLIQRNTDVEWVSLPLSVALVYIPIPIAGLAIVLQALAQIAEAARGKAAHDSGQELPL